LGEKGKAAIVQFLSIAKINEPGAKNCEIFL
jgi:hypothetical protein